MPTAKRPATRATLTVVAAFAVSALLVLQVEPFLHAGCARWHHAHGCAHAAHRGG
jgi:hypothetical protein